MNGKPVMVDSESFKPNGVGGIVCNGCYGFKHPTILTLNRCDISNDGEIVIQTVLAHVRHNEFAVQSCTFACNHRSIVGGPVNAIDNHQVSYRHE